MINFYGEHLINVNLDNFKQYIVTFIPLILKMDI